MSLLCISYCNGSSIIIYAYIVQFYIRTQTYTQMYMYAVYNNICSVQRLEFWWTHKSNYILKTTLTNYDLCKNSIYILFYFYNGSNWSIKNIIMLNVSYKFLPTLNIKECSVIHLFIYHYNRETETSTARFCFI